MKKERQIKAYTRRTKSGKMVAVKAHTAKYDAADMAKEALKKKGAGDEFEQRYRSQFEKKPAGAGSTGRIKKETDQDKAAKLKEVVAKLKKAKASDTAKTKPASKADSTAKKQPVGGGSTGRMKKNTVATKSPSVKDTFGVSDADLKTWWYHPYSKRGLAINKQIKKKIGSRALTNLVVFSMDSASKGQKADSAAFKYVKGLTKFTRKNLKVDAMK